MKISTKEKSKLNNLKNKIVKWKKEGYKVDELDNIVKSVENENEKIKRKKERNRQIKSLIIRRRRIIYLFFTIIT